jgi:hypothetical protein
MGTSPAFEKVGECRYLNPSSGSYYALVKIRGKQIKCSLRTDYLDRPSLASLSTVFIKKAIERNVAAKVIAQWQRQSDGEKLI